MIKIRNESELQNWFKINYQTLGFEKIIRYDNMKFPDFIMLEKGKRVKVELETKSSNFIIHRHDVRKVDIVVCIRKDIDLPLRIIEVKDIQLAKEERDSPYSLENQIYELFSKEKIVTSHEVAKKLKVSWNTADRHLLELAFKGRVDRIKKEGVTLWLKK